MIPNNKHIRFLKTLCHPLSPVVRIGQKGVTDSIRSELEIALAFHELIKIKVSVGDRDERRLIIASLAAENDAFVIQQVGQIAVLFKRNHINPRLEFPARIKAGASQKPGAHDGDDKDKKTVKKKRSKKKTSTRQKSTRKHTRR